MTEHRESALRRERQTLREVNETLARYEFGPVMGVTVATSQRRQETVNLTICQRCGVPVAITGAGAFAETGPGRHWRRHHRVRGAVYEVLRHLYRWGSR